MTITSVQLIQSLETLANSYTYAPKLIATGQDNNPILIADIRIEPYSLELTENILSSWAQQSPNIAFQMLANLQSISIFKKFDTNSVVVINTTDILNIYEPDFENTRIFPHYLTTLIEAWLRDILYHWNSQHPPAEKELNTIGFLTLFDNGWIQSID